MASIRYMVNDVDKAIEFYTKILGFSVDERWGPAFAIVSHADLKLWISGPETSAARAMPDGRVPQPGGWNRFVLEVDDIHSIVDKLKQAGAVFRNEIISGRAGHRYWWKILQEILLNFFKRWVDGKRQTLLANSHNARNKPSG